MTLQPGDSAPLFTLNSPTGKISLKQFRGQTVILYFYPEDDTPLCTTQACAFRDHYTQLQAAGAILLGISPDDIPSHTHFTQKFKLPFPLLADPSHNLAKKYGVWTQKQMFGHKFLGMLRNTFIINPEGIITRIFPRVRVKGHAAAVLQFLNQTPHATAARTRTLSHKTRAAPMRRPG